MFLIGAIDNLIPSAKNPHEVHEEKETAPLHDPAAPYPDFEAAALAGKGGTSGLQDHSHHPKKLLRMGLFTALAIAVHNFPEGLATFLAALQDPNLGLTIAVAVALHNIPEGISVSVPIFYATGNRKKAFTYSLLRGLSEPVGAGVAYLGLRFIVGGESGAIPSQVMGVLFAGGGWHIGKLRTCLNRGLLRSELNMKKQISLALVVFVAIIAFCGCAELQPSISGDKRLNQNELERLFQTDRNVEFFSSTTRVSVKYFSDGRQECNWDSGNDKGTYRIKNDEFCSTWTWLRKGAESCSKIYKIGENEFEFRDSNGNSHAVMRLK